MRRDQYEMAYARLLTIIPDLRDLKVGDYRKSTPTRFGNMDLHLNILSKTETEMVISLAHTFMQNGDTMSDPDMEIRVYLIEGWEKAEAMTYQLDSLGLYQVVYPEPGKVYPKLKKSMNSFLRTWLTNIIAQGHILLPKPEISA